MRFTIRFLVVAILLFTIAACNNDAATNEKTDKENEPKVSGPKDTKQAASVDIDGYWKNERGSYYSISKNGDTFSLNELARLELTLTLSKIEGNTIHTYIKETPDTKYLSLPEEEVEKYLGPGIELTLELSDDKNQINYEFLGEPVTLTKVENSSSVDPIDAVGNWINEKDYITVTKDNNVMTFNFEDGFDDRIVQFEISMEITDVVDDYVFGKITKFLPAEYSTADSYTALGSIMAFRLSDGKLSIMGDSEMTKTDMSLEEFKAQVGEDE
jgi:hypothetical protein